jgi:putative Mn2+ efflux pump MntP
MIKDSFAREVCEVEEQCPNTKKVCTDIEELSTNAEKVCTSTEEMSLSFKKMFPLAIATSIDALAVGVSLAFLKVDIVPAVSLIGIITLLFSMGGVKIGNVFGVRFKSKAELSGGIILILIGLKIILEHTGILIV